MKISDLEVGQGKVNLKAEVLDVGAPKSFNKFGKEIKVANAKIKDDSGEITLTLWNADTEKVKKGDKIEITNGYVKEFQGEKQITSGKFGELKVLGDENKSDKEEKSDKKDKEEEKNE